jgi:hypothetical protein
MDGHCVIIVWKQLILLTRSLALRICLTAADLTGVTDVRDTPHV